MTINISDLHDDATLLLRSMNDHFWTQAFFVSTLNEVVREVVRHRPDSSYTRSDVTTVDGAMQTLPTAAYRLMMIDGMVTNGNVVRALKPKSRALMASDGPAWTNKRAASVDEVEFYAYQDRTPRDFWLDCPPTAGMTVRITHSVIPTGIPATTGDIAAGTIDISDEFYTVILNGILYRAYQRENSSVNTIAAYRGMYYELLGSDDKIDIETHPMNETSKDQFPAPSETRKG